MAGMTRVIHPQSGFRWAPLAEIAPDLRFTADVSSNGNQPPEPMGLMMLDPDGETHVFVFDEDARKKLITELSGGIVLP